jgi:hypothetical protein
MNTTSTARAAQEDPDQFGRRVAARLSVGADELPHDISERLRAGRMQALARRKQAPLRRAAPAVATQVAGVSGGTATLGGGWGRGGWWTRLAAVAPLVALVAGLVTISAWQEDSRTTEMASVEAALLTDDLPPAAYTDPGFAQFLKQQEAAAAPAAH